MKQRVNWGSDLFQMLILKDYWFVLNIQKRTKYFFIFVVAFWLVRYYKTSLQSFVKRLCIFGKTLVKLAACVFIESVPYLKIIEKTWMICFETDTLYEDFPFNFLELPSSEPFKLFKKPECSICIHKSYFLLSIRRGL